MSSRVNPRCWSAGKTGLNDDLILLLELSLRVGRRALNNCAESHRNSWSTVSMTSELASRKSQTEFFGATEASTKNPKDTATLHSLKAPEWIATTVLFWIMGEPDQPL